MAFIKAFSGAFGGSLADQWKDYFAIPAGIGDTVGMCPAAQVRQNDNRGSDTKASENIITNGSLIVVPEGYALITMENGEITGYIEEAGGYQWESESLNSQSCFCDSPVRISLIKQSWERFKFGGMPGSFQKAVFVNLKEIPNLKFGTQNAIYWDDAYLNTQAGAVARGTYTIQITDPIKFLKRFAPAEYYIESNKAFDFADFDNAAAHQLFVEVVGSLAAAFSSYANDAKRQNRITNIQRDSVGFASSLANVVERDYSWIENRGVTLVAAAISAIDYTEDTKELIKKVQQADALRGSRGNSNFQASFAEGIAAAGSNPDGGAMGMGFMGMGVQGISAAYGAFQQEPGVSAPTLANSPAVEELGEDPFQKLIKLKELLDLGIVTQEEFDEVKKKTLGL